MRKSLTIVLLLLFSAAAGADDGPFERFLIGAASRDDARRREALDALLADPSMVPSDRVDRAMKMLVRILEGDGEPALRGRAARCLALFRSTETDLRIVRRLAEESAWRAQRPMIEALDGFTDGTALAFLTRRIWDEPRPDVKALLVEALAMSPAASARDSLLRLAGLPLDWPVLQAAALGLARYPVKEAVDRLIDLLWSDQPGVRAAAYEALVSRTGNRELADEPPGWVAWWAEHRESFAFPVAAAPADGEVNSVVVEPVTLPTYYDIPIRGRRVVFCLDCSASMWGPKFEAARAELARAVASLPSGTEFGVIFFNERPFPWRRELVPARPYQKLALIADLDSLTTKMYTNLFDTLEMALGFAGLGRYALADPPGVDDVFLLTDGEPNRGRRRDEDGILDGLAELDPQHRVRIHTISVGDVPKPLMSAIAAARHGTHTHVP